MLVAGCSSGGSVAAGSEATDSPGSSTPQAPQTTSSIAPTSTIESSGEVALEPLVPPMLATDIVEAVRGEAEFVGEFDIMSIAGVIPGSQSMVFVEQRGEVAEGCEGGQQQLGQLSMLDLDTGESTVVVPDLSLTDSHFYLGPDNGLALVGGCDANAWLEAVGTADAEGNVTLLRLDKEGPDAVRAGGNAGVSVTWTANGEVLFVDTTLVDTATGVPLEPVIDGEPTVRVHAQLSDGTRLISGPSTSLLRPFWVVDDASPLDAVPARQPDVVAQASYPSVQVHIDSAGERAYATFEDWEAGTVWTLIVGGEELLRVPGRARPSPSGSRLLVSTVDTAGDEWATEWAIVDLEAETTSPVTLPVNDAGRWVRWGGSDRELLVTSGEGDLSAPTSVWVLAIDE